MTAQAKKPTKVVTNHTRKPTHKQAVIIKTKHEHPKLTTREIAAIADTDHSHVIKTLQRYGIEREHTDEYKRCRADILAGMQHRLLSSVTPEDIQKTPVGSRILAVAQLYDKERLERNQTTSNVGIGIALAPDMQAAVDRIVARSPVDNSNNQDADFNPLTISSG
jgi:hypothetical protein